MPSPKLLSPSACRALILGLAAMLWQACGGGDLAGPRTGQITVTTATSGEQPDQDGYTISLDGTPGVAIGPNATVTLSAEEGDHDLELDGLAPNCGVDGRVRHAIRVTAGQTTPVPFNVTCSATTGALEIVVATTGAQLDADGYGIVLDQGASRPIGANDTLTLTAIESGDHSVALSGVAGNCSVAGDNPRTVAVSAGVAIGVAFQVTCVATLGVVTVTTTTDGAAPDPDGYTVQADSSATAPVPSAGSVTLAGLTPGRHAIRLGGVAPNCLVQGDNPRAVDVTAGDTAAVSFQVNCAAGVAHWVSMQSGTSADLPEVWGTGAADVFVVGEAFSPQTGDLQSVVLHYDGSRWAEQFHDQNLRLRGVWGSSSADVFAVGFDFASPEARVMHFDGSRWSPMPVPAPVDVEEFSLQSVWGSSPTDVFAVGGLFNGLFDESLILHYDGSAWTRMSGPAQVRPDLLDVWGSSGSDVYAVGRNDAADPSDGVVLRYDGSTWTPVLQHSGLSLRTVWGSSRSDVFAGGFQVEGQDGSVSAAIWHYDGSSWTEMTVPSAGVLYELWGTSASDVFAVGQDGVVLHYDGTAWTATHPTTRTLLGVWGSSPIDVFAVGNGGTILHGTP